jgi:hypothetical protein
MDERDMEEEKKNREREGWGIEIKKVVFETFGIDILGLVMCNVYIVTGIRKGKIKYLYY